MSYTTKLSLLRGIHDNSEKSWNEFWDFYTPLIMFYGKIYGLSNEEKKDLRQEVMSTVMKCDIASKYDTSKGTFRAYFQGVIRNHIISIIRKRMPKTVNLSVLDEYETENKINTAIEDEYEKMIIQAALEKMKEQLENKQFLAFEMYALQNRPAMEVAEILQISVNQVYLAKSRYSALMKEIVESFKRNDF